MAGFVLVLSRLELFEFASAKNKEKRFVGKQEEEEEEEEEDRKQENSFLN